MFCVNLPTQLTFDRVVLVEQRGHAGDFVFVQVAGLGLRIDARLVAQLAGDFGPTPYKYVQRDDRRTIVRNINTEQTRHKFINSSKLRPNEWLGNAVLTLRCLWRGLLQTT